MSPQGSAPFSSILYLTKRKRLSEHLYEQRDETNHSKHQYYYENVFYPSQRPEKYGNAGIHKNLIYLSEDRLKYETSDGVALDVDDGLNRGLNYLSQHSHLMNLSDIEEFLRLQRYKTQVHENFHGKVEDIANLLDLNGMKNKEVLYSDPFERDLELSDKYVGPLNATEVAHLIALALKLQENERLDSDLGKKLEISASSWKNFKVPNTVPDDLIMSLFMNKPYQCEKCGLRFNLSDTKSRHELTHKQKADRFWYPLDGWVQMTSKGAASSTNTRSMVTLETFKNLFRTIPLEDENVNWLKGLLFPNEQPSKDVVMTDELPQTNVELEEEEVSYANENLGDETVIWSWGIMDDLEEPLSLSSTDQQTEDENFDLSLFNLMLKNISFNLLMLNSKNPVFGTFGDLSKFFCALCKDNLNCQFDVKYNKFVYLDTTSFQLDPNVVSSVFKDHVLLSFILSLGNLDKLSVFDLMKKMASIKVISPDTKSKLDLAITDWSFKYTKELLDINSSIPKMDDGWKNPFKESDGSNTRSLLISHTSCLKLFFNSHIRLLKIKSNYLKNEEIRKKIKLLNLYISFSGFVAPLEDFVELNLRSELDFKALDRNLLIL
uniref:C2H2-type domain-containing protein n=1 Tax=Theileria annulata TaxID=5874 RepID=A0A3B0MIM6_THEAN